MVIDRANLKIESSDEGLWPSLRTRCGHLTPDCVPAATAPQHPVQAVRPASLSGWTAASTVTLCVRMYLRMVLLDVALHIVGCLSTLKCILID